LHTSLTIAATLIGSACGSSLEPSDLVGDYALTGVAGRPLPQLIAATPSCDVTLVAGSLKLRVQDWSVLDLVRQEDCTRGGGTIQLQPVRDLGILRQLNGQFSFETAHSITDTLRFPLYISRGTVRLDVEDPFQGLPGPLPLRFGRRRPPAP
jgi:hypothetical protein